MNSTASWPRFGCLSIRCSARRSCSSDFRQSRVAAVAGKPDISVSAGELAPRSASARERSRLRRCDRQGDDEIQQVLAEVLGDVDGLTCRRGWFTLIPVCRRGPRFRRLGASYLFWVLSPCEAKPESRARALGRTRNLTGRSCLAAKRCRSWPWSVLALLTRQVARRLPRVASPTSRYPLICPRVLDRASHLGGHPH